MQRRFVAILLTVIMLFCSFGVQAEPAAPAAGADAAVTLAEEELYSQAAVLVDMETGNVIFSKNSRIRMHPASTTKVMTLLLALESGIPMDTIVTIPQEAAQIPPSSSLVPVNPGEQMTFEDLLYGFFMSSGNDGANAIAVIVGGSLDSFVQMMNRRAQELGCTDTQFANAHGYTQEGHYTTAMDLATITRAAMQNPVFRDISLCQRRQLHITGRDQVVVVNRNLMIDPQSEFYYEECIGVKTGYTNAAGQCFVGAAQWGELTLVSVCLNSNPADVNLKWKDTARLFDYGFAQHDPYSVAQLYRLAQSRFEGIVVQNAREDDPEGGVLGMSLAQVSDAEYVTYVPAYYTTGLEDAVAEFASRCQIQLTREPVAPIAQGEIMGTFTYTREDGSTISAYLVADRNVEMQPEKVTIEELLPFVKIFKTERFRIIFWIVVALIALIIIARIHRARKRARRRKMIYESRKDDYYRRIRDHEYRKIYGHRPPSAQRSSGRRRPPQNSGSRRRSNRDMFMD